MGGVEEFLRTLHLRKRWSLKSTVLSLLSKKSTSFSVAVVCMMGGIEFYFRCELNSPCLAVVCMMGGTEFYFRCELNVPCVAVVCII